jgi:threonine dehydratase
MRGRGPRHSRARRPWDGIHATITVDDAEAQAAMRELAEAKVAIGESGAAPLAAPSVVADPECSAVRKSLPLAPDSRALLVATEGPTDPVTYRGAVA